MTVAQYNLGLSRGSLFIFGTIQNGALDPVKEVKDRTMITRKLSKNGILENS